MWGILAKEKRQPSDCQVVAVFVGEPVGSRTPIEGTGILYSIH